jgi:hypothetical protein
MNNFAEDPMFTELPQKWQDEIKKSPPTSIMDGDTWHEVQFFDGMCICQCAVINGKYVALPQNVIDKFQTIIKIIR